jgi:hypothetical protein
MQHISFVPPAEERTAFRHLCVIWNVSPSKALRTMVRIALGGGYRREQIRGEQT